MHFHFKMKTILVYTGVFTAFQKRSPSTLCNGKRMSHDHSCTLGMRINVSIVVYTVVKDTQSECGKPRLHFQKSPFWSVYTEMQPWSFQTKARSHYKLHSATKQHDPIHFNGELAISGDTSDSDRWRPDGACPATHKVQNPSTLCKWRATFGSDSQ